MGEIAENCQGVKLVLVALKCDLREKHGDDEEETGDHNTSRSKKEKHMIDYKQGLEVARRIHALRYLGKYERLLQTVLSVAHQNHLECSAKCNRGVNEAFTEAARVALSVKASGSSGPSRRCVIM